jgi:hypothetical protein
MSFACRNIKMSARLSILLLVKQSVIRLVHHKYAEVQISSRIEFNFELFYKINNGHESLNLFRAGFNLQYDSRAMCLKSALVD